MVVCVRTQGGRVDPDLEINKDRLQQKRFFRPVAMLMEPDRPAAPAPNRSSHHSYRPPPPRPMVLFPCAVPPVRYLRKIVSHALYETKPQTGNLGRFMDWF